MFVPEHIYVVTRDIICRSETGEMPLLTNTKVQFERFVAGANEDDPLRLVVRDIDTDLRYTVEGKDFDKLERDIEEDADKVFVVAGQTIRYSKDGGKTAKVFRGNIDQAIHDLRAAGYVEGKLLGIIL